MGKFKQILNCHNSGCTHGYGWLEKIRLIFGLDELSR